MKRKRVFVGRRRDIQLYSKTVFWTLKGKVFRELRDCIIRKKWKNKNSERTKTPCLSVPLNLALYALREEKRQEVPGRWANVGESLGEE